MSPANPLANPPANSVANVLGKPMPSDPAVSAVSSIKPVEPNPAEFALHHRPRRLRCTAGLRRMVREAQPTVNDLIYPVFVMEGHNLKGEVASMPGCYRYSLDLLLGEIAAVHELGIPAITLFPLIPYDQKDNAGTESYILRG